VTGSYSLVIKKSAERELRAIPKEELRHVVERARGLADNPLPSGSEKLSGQERYRIRHGDYRIVYAIDDKARVVEIVKRGHRRDVYRKK
jgi:mRNA interferase RelE/StbE